MAIVCPTVTATDPHGYRQQMERVSAFAHRLHVDFMDGDFTPNQSPPIESAWWPDDKTIDLHIMYHHPHEQLGKIISLKPDLVIIHAEAEGHFKAMAEQLHQANIKVGVALLAPTPVKTIASSLNQIDHVLIFSGTLGHFGGQVDLSLLLKVRQLRALKKNLEIGWDGGINDDNIMTLIEAGVNVLNVGGFIHRATQPEQAYATLEALAGQQR